MAEILQENTVRIFGLVTITYFIPSGWLLQSLTTSCGQLATDKLCSSLPIGSIDVSAVLPDNSASNLDHASECFTSSIS